MQFCVRPLFLLLPILVFLVCIGDINNPLDKDYIGDYRFEISWNDLTTTHTDTLEIFTSYTVPFTVTGVDTFASFKVVNEHNQCIVDSAILNEVITKGQKSVTSITIYFIKPCNGTLSLVGVRPNNKEVVSASNKPKHILNPFKLVCDPVWGINDPVKAEIKKVWGDTAGIADRLEVLWQLDNDKIKTLGWAEPFIQSFTETASHSLRGGLVDTAQNTIWLTNNTFNIKGYRPVIYSVTVHDSAELGKPLRIDLDLNDNDKDSIAVSVAVNGNALFDSLEYHSYTVPLMVTTHRIVIDTGNQTFSVRIIDKNGLQSEPYMFTTPIAYTLPQPFFLDSLQNVSVDKTEMLHIIDTGDKPATYRWTIKHLALDTITNGKCLSVRYDTNDTGIVDTVHVTGIYMDKYIGKTARLIIQPCLQKYTIAPVSWPDTIQVAQWNSFSVDLEETTPERHFQDPHFIWRVYPKKFVDSITANGKNFRMFIRDSIDQCLVSVFAIVNDTDTTTSYTRSVHTVLNRPQCSFTSKLYHTTVGQAVRCTLKVDDNGTINNIYTLIEKDTISLGNNTLISETFYQTGRFTIYAWAIDDHLLQSDIDSAVVAVVSKTPYFYPLEIDTAVFIFDTTRIRVYAYPGQSQSPVNTWLWDVTADGIWDTTTDAGCIDRIYPEAGNYTLLVTCKDSTNELAAAPCRIRITAVSGQPQLLDVSLDTNWHYINEPCTITVTAKDTNGIVKSIHIDTDNDTIPEMIVKTDTAIVCTSVVTAFPTAGSFTINIWAKDDDSIHSGIHAQTVIIDPGIPYIIDIAPDSVYINDQQRYTIAAKDNQSISDYAWSLDGIGFTSLKTVPTFMHAFADSGIQYVYALVTDNDNNESAPFKKAVYVRLAPPVVDSMTPRTAWVNDTNAYTFFFHDINGWIQTICIDWGDGSDIQTVYHDNDTTSTVLKHRWPVSSDTSYTVHVSIIDDDSIVSAENFTVHVRQGAPKVQLMHIAITEDSIFVNDPIRFRIKASDNNGFIKMLCAAWHDSSSSQDTMMINGFLPSIDTFFTHTYPVDQSGSTSVGVWSVDEDGVRSAVDDTVITVHLAAPHLQGDSEDTVWVVVDNGSGNIYTLHINSYDINGTILRYYWQETEHFDSSASSCTKTNDSTRTRLISQPEMHMPIKMWIYGLDDDHVRGGGRFVIYPDSVPPAPSVAHRVSTEKVTIFWSGKDAKDQDNTQYRVVMKIGAPITENDENNPFYIISDFKAGLEYESGAPNNDFSFTCVPKHGSGTYYYKVLARDARGSVAKDTTEHSFTF